MLTRQQAYLTMFAFLSEIYQRLRDQFVDDFPTLLSDLEPSVRGFPFDAALWQDWSVCVPHEPISEREAFEAMRCFLEMYQARGDSGEIRRILGLLFLSNAWQDAVENTVGNVGIHTS